MIDSAKIYRMEVPFTADQLSEAAVELVRENDLASCYIRPIVLRGYGDMGVHRRQESDRDVSWRAGNGASIWGRSAQLRRGCLHFELEPDRAEYAARACRKPAANYMNSQLIRMEADVNGYAEGIALDQQGYISEGSGENLFVVRDGKILTPPLGASVLPGITRDSVLKLARSPGYSGCGDDHSARTALHRR